MNSFDFIHQSQDSKGSLAPLKIEVLHDINAGVYVASSKDLRGLVAEAETMDELKEEVRLSVEALLKLRL